MEVFISLVLYSLDGSVLFVNVWVKDCVIANTCRRGKTKNLFKLQYR